MRYLRVTLVFAVYTVAPLISESLLGNTPVNANSPKVCAYFSLFSYLVLIFVLSQVNLLHILGVIDVMLEDNNSCLTNNKKLGVKYVLIVFG